MTVDRADKREHIIHTAIELFAVKGFEGTSIRDLAATAGVNIAMINYYFGSKEKLFESIVEHKAMYTRQELNEVVNNASFSQLDKIRKIMEGFVDRILGNRHFHRVIHQEMMLSNRESLQNMIVNTLYPNTQIIKDVIEEGIRRKEFKKLDVDLTVATLMGTINYLLLSKKFCNKMLNKEEGYLPYEDEKFKKRLKDHLKTLLQDHLVN